MFIRFSLIGLLLVSSVALAERTPIDWLESMDSAHQKLNFTLPMVHLEPNSAQTYLFEHGVSNNKQVVYMAALSGPVRHSYRVDNKVTYLEPESRPYTINATKIVGASPALFVGKIQHIIENYSMTMVEKGRIAGRVTQLIRLKAKDGDRFNYILWLDLETSLLLRYDLFDLDNNLLEQVQAVGLNLNTEPSENIIQLSTRVNDQVHALTATQQDRWTFNWLPSGFVVQASDSHRVDKALSAVEYVMLSDGLSQVSVYIAKASTAEIPAKLQTNSGITMANKRYGQYDVTVVGRIPYDTAFKIANAVEAK